VFSALNFSHLKGNALQVHMNECAAQCGKVMESVKKEAVLLVP